MWSPGYYKRRRGEEDDSLAGALSSSFFLLFNFTFSLKFTTNEHDEQHTTQQLVSYCVDYIVYIFFFLTSKLSKLEDLIVEHIPKRTYVLTRTRYGYTNIYFIYLTSSTTVDLKFGFQTEKKFFSTTEDSRERWRVGV